MSRASLHCCEIFLIGQMRTGNFLLSTHLLFSFLTSVHETRDLLIRLFFPYPSVLNKANLSPIVFMDNLSSKFFSEIVKYLEHEIVWRLLKQRWKCKLSTSIIVTCYVIKLFDVRSKEQGKLHIKTRIL